LDEGVGRFCVVVVLEDRLDIGADLDWMFGIAEQVAYHSDVVGVRELDEDNQVGARLFQSGVGGVPDAFPAEDLPVWLNGRPSEIE
jgi:hypothetical protein